MTSPAPKPNDPALLETLLEHCHTRRVGERSSDTAYTGMPREESHQIEKTSQTVTHFHLSSVLWQRSQCTATAVCARRARQPWVSFAPCRSSLSTLLPSTSPRQKHSSLDSLVASPRYSPPASTHDARNLNHIQFQLSPQGKPPALDRE